MTKTVKQLLACGMALTILSTGVATTAVTVNDAGQIETIANAAAINAHTPDETTANNFIKPVIGQLHGVSLRFDSGSFVVNGNKTNLNSAPSKPTNAPLDNLDRPSSGSLLITSSTVAASRSRNQKQESYHPKGWNNKQLPDGTWTENRGHILAYELMGGVQGFDNSEHNPTNIFTESTWANAGASNDSKGQEYYENMIKNQVAAGKQVYYHVQLLYNGNELVPRAVWLQARSTDGQFQINALIPNTMGNGASTPIKSGTPSIAGGHDSSSQGAPEQDQSQQPTASDQQVLPQTSGSLWSRVLSWFGLN